MLVIPSKEVGTPNEIYTAVILPFSAEPSVGGLLDLQEDGI